MINFLTTIINEKFMEKKLLYNCNNEVKEVKRINVSIIGALIFFSCNAECRNKRSSMIK
ncbi:hypothetical protein [Clostridium sp. CTA-7]